MSKNFFAVVLVSALVFSGCAATQSTWEPVVDPQGDSNAANIESDKSVCRQFAEQGTRDTAQEAGKGALVGGAIGAAAGAAIGAAVGSPGKGAMVGAAAGGIGGGGKSYLDKQKEYEDIFRNCMKNRGHSVLN